MPHRRADLQFHSTWSDGYKTVPELVRMLAERQITIGALTDHNTVAGVPEMIRLARARGIRIIPATEIYANAGSRSFHILGYNIAIRSRPLSTLLEQLRVRRIADVRRCFAAFAQRGFVIPDNAIADDAQGYIGVGDLYGILLRSRNNRAKIRRDTGVPFAKITDFYGTYFGRSGIRLRDAAAPLPTVIQAIRRARGVAVLSHPGAQLTNPEAPSWIARLKRLGIRGIEVLSPYHNWRQIELYQDLALRHGLFMTMGSDYHGDLISYRKPVAIRTSMDYYHSPEGFLRQMMRGLKR